jgi:hypothetical protein
MPSRFGPTIDCVRAFSALAAAGRIPSRQTSASASNTSRETTALTAAQDPGPRTLLDIVDTNIPRLPSNHQSTGALDSRLPPLACDPSEKLNNWPFATERASRNKGSPQPLSRYRSVRDGRRCSLVIVDTDRLNRPATRVAVSPVNAITMSR